LTVGGEMFSHQSANPKAFILQNREETKYFSLFFLARFFVFFLQVVKKTIPK
jgi:hypothetical protein